MKSNKKRVYFEVSNSDESLISEAAKRAGISKEELARSALNIFLAWGVSHPKPDKVGIKEG